MSSATRIYWYPMGTGNVETISLDFVTNLNDDDPVVSAATSTTIAGGMRRQLYGDWRRLVLIRQHLRPSKPAEAEAIRALRSLQSHLLAGYSVGLAIGTNATWGGFTVGPIARGISGIGVLANTYLPWSSTGTVVVGDEIVLQSQSPFGAREVHRVSAVIAGSSGGKILTLDRPTFYNHPGPVLVRRRTFFPHLKLPDDQLDRPIITSRSRGQTFDFRIELREDMQEAFDLGQSGQTLAGATGQAVTQFAELRARG